METVTLLAIACIVLVVMLAISYRRRNILRDENVGLRVQIAKFDRDGDGKIGGSKPGVSKPINAARPNAFHQGKKSK